MIVCVCRGVKCSSVRSAIASGALTVEDVGAACGAGTDCGSCQGMIEDMIETAEEGAEGVVRVDARGRSHLAVNRSAA